MSLHTNALAVDGPLDVQELHRDLARKLRNVGSKVDAIWRNFTPKQRETAFRESTGDGEVLKHSQDRSLGAACDYIPELNLRDMTSNPEHFLNLFRFRASNSLHNQLYEGVNNMPGDRELIKQNGIRYKYASEEEQTFFFEGDEYGQSFRPGPAAGGRDPFAGLPDFAYDIIIPRAHGECILMRQQHLFQSLNHIVEEILHLRSKTRAKKAPAESNINEALVAAVTNLRIEPKPLKCSLPEVRAQAMDSKAALEDYLLLLRTEPTVLNQAVKTAYWNRPELVPDDKGRVLPKFTDRHLSVALFEAVTTAVKAISIWDYIVYLLQLLEDGVKDKVKRALILQEFSNTCNLEYRRAQESFKRNIAPHFACKRFKRLIDASGQPKVLMKGLPAEHTISDPQLHYALRLCHPETSPRDAVQWIEKIDSHNTRYIEDARKFSEAEIAALSDLAVIVSFMRMASTSTALPMAPVSRKSGLLFTARSKDLEDELHKLKPKADFGDYLIPMDNLLEPQMATKALAALDQFIAKEREARLGSLYEKTVQDSVEDLDRMLVEAKARLEKAGKTTYVPLPADSPPQGDAKLEQRTAKEKTRPSRSSVYTITSPPEAEPQQPTIPEPVEPLKVKAATSSLFTTLFSKSEARGSVSWTDFEAAMADLGFSVTPKGGSVYTFNPPESMNSRPITLHRPHASGVEGYKLLILARRLQRVYGWTEGFFVVA